MSPPTPLARIDAPPCFDPASPDRCHIHCILRAAKTNLEAAIVQKVNAEDNANVLLPAVNVIRNCCVSCGDGSLVESPARGDGYQCGNMKLLLKQQQRILLGRSDIASWGAFIKIM